MTMKPELENTVLDTGTEKHSMDSSITCDVSLEEVLSWEAT